MKDVIARGNDLCFGDRLKTRVRVLKKMLELGDEGKLGGTWKLGERYEIDVETDVLGFTRTYVYILHVRFIHKIRIRYLRGV